MKQKISISPMNTPNMLSAVGVMACLLLHLPAIEANGVHRRNVNDLSTLRAFGSNKDEARFFHDHLHGLYEQSALTK
jgi:hypothetical protein